MTLETVKIKKIKCGAVYECEDVAASECLYDIIIKDEKVFTVSCTPEALKEFTLGFLYNREIIQKREQAVIEEISEKDRYIIVSVKPEKEKTGSIKKIPDRKNFPGDREILETGTILFEQPGELFRATGCAHFCAFWEEGKVVCSYEDIGRHNALDKVSGYLLEHEISPENGVIFTSGRISADYLKKVIRAGVYTVVSHAAVTGEAIRLAKEKNVRMYGFVRNGCGNLYTDGVNEKNS